MDPQIPALKRAPQVTVIGAGLAGSECAWQLAERGFSVALVEQKPAVKTAAQTGDGLAELVCSNSFRGAALANAVGLLKEEMRRAGSLIMAAADATAVPAGGALAVDRDHFSAVVTERIEAHPQIELIHREVKAIPALDHPVVIATGPLTGDALAADLAAAVGKDHLAYYDAIAPVVTADSVNWDVAFMKSRYDKGGDAAYGNCPLDKAQYEAFVQALIDAEKVAPRAFEEARYFEGCLPVDVMAERGLQTLAFGPMKPVGLEDPRTGERPHAVVQLRQENRHATAFNLVGFQTRLKWPEQKRVLRMIPGLEEAEFERLGSVHRNTYVDSPRALDDDLALKSRPGVYLAGQVSGVEGYLESAAGGLVLATMLARKLRGETFLLPPETTALGGLIRHLRDEQKDFSPSNVVWSMMPPLPGRKIRKRRPRREKLAARALADLTPWLIAIGRDAPAPELSEVADVAAPSAMEGDA